MTAMLEYVMGCLLTQQLYDEDKDFRVEMAELLLPIFNDSNHDSLFFFR
jgi:hypothetical protein